MSTIICKGVCGGVTPPVLIHCRQKTVSVGKMRKGQWRRCTLEKLEIGIEIHTFRREFFLGGQPFGKICKEKNGGRILGGPICYLTSFRQIEILTPPSRKVLATPCILLEFVEIVKIK